MYAMQKWWDKVWQQKGIEATERNREESEG